MSISRVMRAAAVATLLTGLATACGAESPEGSIPDRSESTPLESTPLESTPPESTPPESTPLGSNVDWVEIAVVHAPQIGAPMDPTPVVLDNRAAIDAYAAGFGRSADQLAREIRQVIKGAGLPQGWVAMAGVINVGCDVPEGVSVDTASGVALAPVGLPKGTVECLVAHTSVGVVGVAPEVG